MCLLALMYRVVNDAPVVVGANREEFYARGGEPPRIIAGACPALAGVDPAAGGTWLGVNATGLLVAVTNRAKTAPPPQPRSRGLLARDLLGLPDAAAAHDHAVRELQSGRYAGCSFLLADRERALVIHAGEWLNVLPLPPGLHLLASRDVNDYADPRLAYAHDWLSRRRLMSSEDGLTALRQLCGQTGTPQTGTPSICLRGPDRGTVSSSLIALRTPPAAGAYLHAQGPPDQTPYQDYSHLLETIRPRTPAGHEA